MYTENGVPAHAAGWLRGFQEKKADAEMGESRLCSSLEGPFLNFETRSLIMYMDHVHEPPAQPSRTQLSREKCNKNAIPWS